MPRPTVQTVPLFDHSAPSSVWPLQSLSSASQTSVPPAPAPTLHTVAAPGLAELQMYVPVFAQTPVPAVQIWPLFAQIAFSSVKPSQSLSRPSQTSVPGAPATAVQTVAPPGLAA